MEINTKLHSLDFLVIAIYLIVLVAIGMWVSFKNREANDLFLGGRSLKWPVVGLSIWGTNIGPSSLIGAAGIAYSSGMVAASFEWYAWVFLFLLAMLFIPLYSKTKISTLPQFIKKRYGETAYTYFSYYSLFTIVILWLGGTLYAGGLLFGQIMGWPTWASVIFLMIIATSFTAMGGLLAVMITDSFQTILIIIGSTVLVVIAFLEIGGLERVIAGVPADYWSLIQSDNTPYPWYAILLGYPVMGIWFFCTDQTIVQRVLGAKNRVEGQRGALFAGYLKILTPFLFMLPGIFCFILHPDLNNPDEAFVFMVANYLPIGMTGLIIAVLVAALISSVDSGLNSFSTIFTLDIYSPKYKSTSPQKLKTVGRLVTVGAAIIAILFALAMETVAKDLFTLLQSIIAFIAPPISAVFIVGTAWKKASERAAIAVLTYGAAISLGVGYCQVKQITFGLFPEWPHFLLLSFFLFLLMVLIMIITSLLSTDKTDRSEMFSLKPDRSGSEKSGGIWMGWIILAIIMLGIYIVFGQLS